MAPDKMATVSAAVQSARQQGDIEPLRIPVAMLVTWALLALGGHHAVVRADEGGAPEGGKEPASRHEKPSSGLSGAAAAVIMAPVQPYHPVRLAQTGADVTLPEIRERAKRQAPSSEALGGYVVPQSRSSTGLTLTPREIPQSVSVMTRERIQDQGAATLSDVIKHVPGVSVKTTDSRGKNFQVRGFPVDNIQIDGVPMEWSGPWSTGETRDGTVIYDRIEVVRGATGLLTGSGQPSAAINQIRKRADSKVFRGEVALRAGRWSQYGMAVDLSAPLAQDGSIRGRLVAEHDQHESFIDFHENKRQVLYGVVDADLLSNTQLSVGVSYQKDTPVAGMWGGLPAWYDDGSRIDWPVSKNTAARWGRWGSTEQTWFASLTHQQGAWQWRADLSQIRRKGEARLLWAVGTPNRVTGLGLETEGLAWYDNDRKQRQVRVEASRPFEWFGHEHEVMLGGSHGKLDFTAMTRDQESEVAPIGDFNAWDGSYPYPGTFGPSYLSAGNKSVQSALYAVTRLQLTDPLKIILGARLSNWQRDEAATQDDAAYTIRHRRKLTPYAGLVYDIQPELSAYASYTTIFKPQEEQDVQANYLEPLAGNSHEVGLKGAWLEGKLNASLALFRLEQDNLAEPDADNKVMGTDNQAYRAAKGTRTTGYEIEIVGQLAPQWDLSLGWTQYKAKDAAGKEVSTRHPRKVLKLFTKYRLPGEWQGLTLGGGISWEGRTYADVRNPVTSASEQLAQPAFLLLDLMAQYRIDNRWTAQLNIDNVLDKKYYSSVGFFNRYTYGEPRRYLLSLKYRF
ncbi:MAG: TonB-dependent siderophore receptor [Lautropia sp.]|nr:TonB-dependent siderophore receptor [Lautropia sp.]